MPGTSGKSEMHGCIVCGRLYQLLAAYDANGKYIGSRVMTGGGKVVMGTTRPLVACETHTGEEIEEAAERVYGEQIWETE